MSYCCFGSFLSPIFSLISKVWSMLRKYIFPYTLLPYFFCFWSNQLYFYYIYFLFDKVLDFYNKINYSKTNIGHKKLSLELYMNTEVWSILQSDSLRIFLGNISASRSYLNGFSIGKEKLQNLYSESCLANLNNKFFQQIWALIFINF